MNLVGLTVARNEDWILDYSMRAALMWVDQLVILDHGSTDRTPEIIAKLEEDYPSRVHPFHTDDPVWNEMTHRQFTLDRGREIQGTHFAIIDADEVLTSNYFGRVKEWTKNLKPGECLDLPMFAVWGDLDHYRSDPCVWSHAWITTTFRDKPGLHWAATGGYHHHARPPKGGRPRTKMGEHGKGGIMHYQFADPQRLRAKHAWYKMMERVRYPDRSVGKIERTYNRAMDERGLEREPLPAECDFAYYKLKSTVTLGQPSWHNQAVGDMLSLHGRDFFKGLNLFGVV